MLVRTETKHEDLADGALESHLSLAQKIFHKLHRMRIIQRSSLKSPMTRGTSPLLTTTRDAGLVKVDNLSISWNYDKENALLRNISFEVNGVSIYLPVLCILHYLITVLITFKSILIDIIICLLI